jgi:hypothetical protein
MKVRQSIASISEGDAVCRLRSIEDRNRSRSRAENPGTYRLLGASMIPANCRLMRLIMRRLRFLQHSFADSLGGRAFTSHLLAVEFRCSAKGTGSSLCQCDPGQNRIELGSLTVVDEIQKSVLSPAPAHSFFIPRIRAKARVIMDLAAVIVRTSAAALVHDGRTAGQSHYS